MLQNRSSSRIWEHVELSARCDAPVLISCDERVDATAIGLWIHGRSQRQAGPFVVLDSRTLDPDVQFESVGRAQGAPGTLFLTHLEAMPLGTQSRLCQFLERREMRDPSMFRVVAAADRLVFARVQAGQIREDLFYRLNVIHIVFSEALDDEVPGGHGLLGVRQ